LPPPAIADVVTALEAAYAARDLVAFTALLHPDFAYGPLPIPNRPWHFAHEVRAHRRMFTPDDLAPGDPPVPADLRVLGVDIELTIVTMSATGGAGAERATQGAPSDFPGEWTVRCAASVLVHTAGPTDYQVTSIQTLVLDSAPGASSALRIRGWIESFGAAVQPAVATPATQRAVEQISWTRLRRLYDGN
jgi:hypothetical protein